MADDIPPPPPLQFGTETALFLDFDGTLVDLAEAPDAIRVPGELPALLATLGKRLGGRLAIVSGRSLGDLDRHLDGAGIAMSGSHGLELRLADGRLHPAPRPAELDSARAEIASFASANALVVEEKPASIALHYRQAPEREGEVRRLMEALAARSGLTVQQARWSPSCGPRARTRAMRSGRS